MSSNINNRIEGDLPTEDPETAAASIDANATILVSGFGSVGYPKSVPLALAASDRELSLTVVSAGSVGDGIDVDLVEDGSIDRRYVYQARPVVREKINSGEISFNDRHVSSLGDEVQYGNLVDPDIAIVEAIAVGEDWFIPSTSIGQTAAFVNSVDKLIVEINTAQPDLLKQFHDIYYRETPPHRDPIPLTNPGDRIGTAHIEFDPSALTAVVESDEPDEPYTFRDPTEEDLALADNLRRFLETEVKQSALYEESVRLQFGVGSLGNALMQALGNADLGDRDLIYFGEVIQDGLLDLLDNNQLQSASATSLALSTEGQNRLFEHADRYAENVVLRPADISNSPELVNRFGVIAVNSALEIDLYGHANSTHVRGTQMVNGIGGSGDFTRNAPLAIMALPSEVNNSISRIVPMVPHVDHTEHDIDVVVTEHGVADLRGTSPYERARMLVRECAHPDYRQDLYAYLERAHEGGGHIPHDLNTVFSWNSNNNQ